MAGRKQPVAFLDTHVVMWLYDAWVDRFTDRARQLLNQAKLVMSPMVLLELGYLQEIGRITPSPSRISLTLARSIGLQQSTPDMEHVVTEALTLHWTRDPFDRLITAEAMVNDAWLISADRAIQTHYSHALC